MSQGSVGFYGKLPIVGDFVTRRLPKEFISSLDQWMQSGISISKEELGDQWLNLYLTSPIWRFAFHAGLCGENAWVGIMMPSVDKVGRYYPMVLACQLDEPNDLSLVLSHSDAWFSRLEEVALAGLEEQYNLEGFNEAILELDLPVLEMGKPKVAKDSNDQLSTHLLTQIELDDNSVINDTIMLASLQAMYKNGDRYSLWLNIASESDKGAFKIYKGLPTGHDYSGMIA